MKAQSRWTLFVLAIATTALGVFCLQPPSRAQSEKPAAAPPHLNPQESSGENLFLQHCALCHLPKLVKPHKSVGPSLTGVLKDASPEQEKAIREFILTGTEKMPGFRYGLKPNELDDIIAYIKTLGA
jgi:mono/diheme cytochrome c family protein